MALTNTAVQNANPDKAAYKQGDAGGLFLLVTPSGGKRWRLKYRFGGGVNPFGWTEGVGGTQPPAGQVGLRTPRGGMEN